MVGGQPHTFLHLPFRLCHLFFCWRVTLRALPVATEPTKSEVGRETDAKTQVCLGVHL